MASVYQYISIMSGATSDGVVEVTCTSDLGEVSTTLVPVSEGDSTGVIALKVRNSLRSSWSAQGVLFSGSPAFSGDQVPVSYASERCDHVVVLWSQVVFDLSIVLSEDPGCLVYSGATPVYVTLDLARSRGPRFGQSWTDSEGDSYDDSEVIDSLAALSELASGVAGDAMVRSPFVHVESCLGTSGVFYGRTPIWSWDLPLIRRPYQASVIPVQTDRGMFDMNEVTGVLDFVYSQMLIENSEPFSYGNLFLGSYVGGPHGIPPGLSTVILRYSVFCTINPVLGSLQHGTFKVGIRDLDKVREGMEKELQQFTVEGPP